MSAPARLVSVREFARLDGCNDKLVRRAVQAGKLPISADGRIDAALAKTGWRQANRRADPGADTSADKGADTGQVSAPGVRTRKVSAPPPDPAALDDDDFLSAIFAGQFHTEAEAIRVKENALAAKGLLAARKEAGELVSMEVAEAVLFDQARQVRDAWSSWPSRVGPLIAARLGVAPEPVVEVLTEYVQQHLSDQGEPDPDFADADEDRTA